MRLLRLWRRRSGLDRRHAARLRAAFAREREAGGRLLAYARAAAALTVAAWLLISRPQLDVIYYLGLLAMFAGLPLVLMRLARRGRLKPWAKYALSALDAALLTAALVLPNPLAPGPPLPAALSYHFANFPYYFVLLAPTVLSLSPGYVLWTGFVGALAWAGGIVWVLLEPHTKALLDPAAFIALPRGERLALLADPNFVDLSARYQEIVLLLAVTAVLAIAVARSRRLVRRQAAAERERGNLARYFSPNVVDALAQLDDPLGAVRRQRVAVLFADIVGFSGFAEHAAPEEVIRLLRDHYERLAGIVFAHGGTLDKYIGDALMATFGTPEPSQDDAARALACAWAMIKSLDEWNAERTQRGEMPVRMGIGIHYGAVVLGNIGSERRLEFTVIGDTVNIACRLEALTRKRNTRLIVSERLVEAVREELGAGRAGPLLESLTPGGSIPLRGRDGEVQIWMASDGAAEGAAVSAPALEPLAMTAAAD